MSKDVHLLRKFYGTDPDALLVGAIPGPFWNPLQPRTGGGQHHEGGVDRRGCHPACLGWQETEWGGGSEAFIGEELPPPHHRPLQ